MSPRARPEVTVDDGFTLATAGDCIISRPISHLAGNDETWAGVMGLLRGSNASFGNLETTIVDLREPGVHPWSVPEDDTVRAEPACATDLKAMGFSLLGRANNHGMDWGVGGLLATTRHLDAAGLVHAGAGVSASAARAPAYLETPQGRVALVSLTTSPSHEAAPATDPSGTVPARPGVATIRVKATVTLPPEGMELLEALRDLYPESDSNWTSPREPLTESDVFRTRFVAGPAVGVSYQADEKDVRAAMRAVRLGAQHADLCMVAIHANQVSREVIAAAFPDPEGVTDADLQSVLSDDFEVEAFFESALAVTRFEAGAVSEVRLHPVELGYGLGLTRKGIPRRAPAEAAGEILSAWQRCPRRSALPWRSKGSMGSSGPDVGRSDRQARARSRPRSRTTAQRDEPGTLTNGPASTLPLPWRG